MVIPVLGRIFLTHGLPENVTSDIRLPFQSHEFAEYMKVKGIIYLSVALCFRNRDMLRVSEPFGLRQTILFTASASVARIRVTRTLS